MRTMLRRVADVVIGSAPVTRRSRASNARRLRILGYHGVDDPARFAAQMEHLAAHYSPVSSAQVVDWLHHNAALPDHAVWVTFDDGEPSVVEDGLPVLEKHHIPATLFVCPGMLDGAEPFWWQVVAAAQRRALIEPSDGLGASPVGFLKTVPNATRLSTVAELRQRLEARGLSPATRQMTRGQLREFAATGGTVGNHTWDHPLLDHCDDVEQSRQISEAHDWLTTTLGATPDLFAFPNGNVAQPARRALADLGYRAALLFDHEFSSRQDPLSVSRLRANSTDSMDRFRAVVAGSHVAVSRWRNRRT